MQEKYESDIERTLEFQSESQTPSDITLVTDKFLEFASSTLVTQMSELRSDISSELKETKREIEERVNEIKSVQKDVRLTRNTNWWLIAFAAGTLFVTILNFCLK